MIMIIDTQEMIITGFVTLISRYRRNLLIASTTEYILVCYSTRFQGNI